MKKIHIVFCLFLFLVCPVLPARAVGVEEQFNALVLRYGERDERRAEAVVLRKSLEGEADRLPSYDLWKSLFRRDISPRKGAANALFLLSSLVDRGDPAYWDSASGFFYPSLTPKPLVAADSIYMAAFFLLRMEEKSAGHLASFLFERFLESARGKHLFLFTGPAEYALIVSELTSRQLLPSFGHWPEGETIGKLPFAAPIRGGVTYGRALSEKMIFLDAAGRPASNGVYAWDRKRGEIYNVIDDQGKSVFIPGD